MKRFALYLGLATALVASCSIQEEDFKTSQQDKVIYYASFEQPAEDGTRVYANEDLLLRWTADDRVSIFGNNTYNQQYKFLGETGDNSGGFSKVDVAEYVTGNPISHTVSVYPYQASTKITEDEVLTVTLPAEQHYAENTFGLGANTMVSVSEDNFLQYKNVGGYLMLKLYGEGVTVSSITLKGNNGEKLAGKATVTMPLDGTPTVVMADDSSTEITLVCDTPVSLGATAEESKQFWFVVPTVMFSKGFTVMVSGDGGVFEKTTDKSLTIERNNLSKMSPIEVMLQQHQPNNVIIYTSSTGEVVSLYGNNGGFGANMISHEYREGRGIISFDGDVTRIGESVFRNCSSLTEIIIPESVKSIDRFAFYKCSGLKGITIPSGVTHIGDYAFTGCSSLTGIIDIPDGVTKIGSAIFADCSSLSGISIPDGVTSIGNYAFQNCSGLKGELAIPQGVTRIGVAAFLGCSNLTGSITIPEGVTSMEASVFQSCSGLTGITFPSGLTSIGENTFSGCSGLTGRLTIPDAVTSIGRAAFWNCSNLTGSITIPEGVTRLMDYTFAGCSGLTSVTIPDGVTSIGKYAFSFCSNLTGITLPSELTSIGDNAFSGCSGLTGSITIPEGVTKIENSVFERCSNLTGIALPDGVTSIGIFAFADCYKLTEFSIPDSVTSIGNSAFLRCSSLKGSFNIPEGVTSIGEHAFHGCTGLTFISIPAILTSIERATFMECSGLTCIMIPNSVTSIGDIAFEYCSGLTSITIPAEVTSIGFNAFYCCSGLANIIVLPENPPTGAQGMFELTSNASIFVPTESVEAYLTAQFWSNYADRIQAIPSSPVPVPEAIDLGLPSGVKWASFNLGATIPEEYGDYYAWGETEPYYSSLDPLVWKEGKESGYEWTSYKWCMGSKNTLTKYCTDSYSNYGYNEFSDDKTVLDPEDDAAHANLGGNWRMPTDAEWMELRENCTWTWTTQNGVNGRLVTANNGNSIFLPVAGLWNGTNLGDVGSLGNYWSSSLCTGYPVYALGVIFDSNNVIIMYEDDRFYGFSVRPVCD